MIQNPTILEKLEKKTQGDKTMRQFIEKIMENEAAGKQYGKFYRTEIEKSAKERRKT